MGTFNNFFNNDDSCSVIVQLSISISVTVDKNNLAMKSVEVKC